jgi:hypothetical protein
MSSLSSKIMLDFLDRIRHEDLVLRQAYYIRWHTIGVFWWIAYKACWSESQFALFGEIALRQERLKNRMMRKTERNISEQRNIMIARKKKKCTRMKKS